MANNLKIITSGEIFIIRDKANLKNQLNHINSDMVIFSSNKTKASISFGEIRIHKRGKACKQEM